MYRKIMLGTAAVMGFALLAGCNQETSYTTTKDLKPSTTTAQNEPAPPPVTSPAPGTNNETFSATQDAVGGVVGTLNAELTTTAKGFANAAAMGDMYEVQASQLAVNRAKSPDVKKFAQDMIEAHTKTTNELKSAVTKAKDITLPKELDSRHAGMMDNLKGASAADFEGRYIAQQINAHNEALILMRGYAKDGDNPGLKSFAVATEPHVQTHLDMIENIDRTHRAKDSQAQNSGTSNTKTKTR